MEVYEIRNLTKEQLDTAVEWAALEGWNPSSHDTTSFYAADETGFFGGFLDDEMIASISAVNYNNQFGFVGLYIVKPEYRGKGYGYKLWQYAMKYLEGVNTGLDGVVAQQENYKKSGFKLAYRNVRYEGRADKVITHLQESGNVRPYNEEDFDKLAEYDSKIFTLNREKFLRNWVKYKTYIAEENGAFTGYGTIRQCGKGFKIGPLFCENSRTAESVLKTLVEEAGNDVVYLDVPEVNKSAVELAEKCGMKIMYETARMYTMKDPGVPLDKVFGITTFELG